MWCKDVKDVKKCKKTRRKNNQNINEIQMKRTLTEGDGLLYPCPRHNKP